MVMEFLKVSIFGPRTRIKNTFFENCFGIFIMGKTGAGQGFCG